MSSYESISCGRAQLVSATGVTGLFTRTSLGLAGSGRSCSLARRQKLGKRLFDCISFLSRRGGAPELSEVLRDSEDFMCVPATAEFLIMGSASGGSIRDRVPCAACGLATEGELPACGATGLTAAVL